MLLFMTLGQLALGTLQIGPVGGLRGAVSAVLQGYVSATHRHNAVRDCLHRMGRALGLDVELIVLPLVPSLDY